MKHAREESKRKLEKRFEDAYSYDIFFNNRVLIIVIL
jgi:hypothetical protein